MADVRDGSIVSSIGLDDGDLRGSEHNVIGWDEEWRSHCHIWIALLDG